MGTAVYSKLIHSINTQRYNCFSINTELTWFMKLKIKLEVKWSQKVIFNLKVAPKCVYSPTSISFYIAIKGIERKVGWGQKIRE